MIVVGANMSITAMSIKGIKFHSEYGGYKKNPITQETQSWQIYQTNTNQQKAALGTIQSDKAEF